MVINRHDEHGMRFALTMMAKTGGVTLNKTQARLANVRKAACSREKQQHVEPCIASDVRKPTHL